MQIPVEASKRSGDENIVPMINIVFLLLIFFLLSGTLSQRPPFELDPVSTTLQPPSEAPQNGLFVSAKGDLYFRGEMISVQALSHAVSAADGNLEVVVDRRLPGGLLFPILEALASSGNEKVRLVTERSIAE
ncbi:MAG: biopolymer transporter ExbD [Hyphomicrobiaceae bacterium]|nr:biopolymer transporter ExbD [Hyphomicrobiaceae bacterium]